MFASPSRLDLYFVLGPKQKGDMKTIMSLRHSPPLPIEINYSGLGKSVTTKEMDRILAALKHPDRIRGITLTGSADDLNKLYKAAIGRRPFPALKNLALCDRRDKRLNIPASFLRGTDLHLRTLKLEHVSLPSISRFLSSAPALTDLTLVLRTKVDPPLSLLSYLKGMPCLRRLELEIDGEIDGQVQSTKPEEKFTLAKLTSFRYRGYSAFLNTFMAMVAASSVREINIDLYDFRTVPLVPHLPRFIDDIGERCHAVQVCMENEKFHFLLFTQSEYVGRHSPHLRLCTNRFFESVMHTSNAFSTMVTAAEELVLVFACPCRPVANVRWHMFLQHFRSLKTLRILDPYYFIASAFHPDHGGLNPGFLPALETIEICRHLWYHDSESNESEREEELAAFELFASARQQAGLQVEVVKSNREINDVLR